MRIRKLLNHILERITHWLRYRRLSVIYVNEEINWVIYWVNHYLIEGLDSCCNIRAGMTDDPWDLTRKIIHFTDRYEYLYGPRDTLDASNQVFLTWYHGDPNDDRGEFHEPGIRLRATQDDWEKVVTSCHITRQQLVAFGIPSDKVAVIPIGIDLSQFAPPQPGQRQQMRQQLGIPLDAVCIGSFQKDGAGWDEGLEPKWVKGPDVFLSVIDKLHQNIDNLYVLLTGPARGYVKQRLEQLGVPYQHHYLADYHQIVDYYYALDLYIIASRVEGGPKALLESWATGVPLVSTQVGMAADLIRHGENGMLAGVEDVQALVNASLTLLNDPQLNERCVQQGLQDVRAYDWPKIAQQYYQELYHPLLAR